MTVTEVKNITIKEFILNQTISFSKDKEFFLIHTCQGSIAREMVENFVFEIDLPFIDSKNAKSFMAKEDYDRIESQRHSEFLDGLAYGREIKRVASAVHDLLNQYKNSESED